MDFSLALVFLDNSCIYSWNCIRRKIMIDVIIQNDPTYLFIQWLGWDWNFWTMIFAHIITFAIFFGIIFLIGFIFMCLGWLE